MLFRSEAASLSSVSAGSSPVAAAGPSAHAFQRQPGLSGDSEVDFSPATGPTPLHPVPSSSNGGATLDWSLPAAEDSRERRWSISITKRKGKELSLGTNKEIIEKQESLYAGKCSKWSIMQALAQFGVR